jgi:hypothetical protein
VHPDTRWLKSCVGFGMEDIEKKIYHPCRGSNSDPWAILLPIAAGLSFRRIVSHFNNFRGMISIDSRPLQLPSLQATFHWKLGVGTLTRVEAGLMQSPGKFAEILFSHCLKSSEKWPCVLVGVSDGVTAFIFSTGTNAVAASKFDGE